MGLSADYTISSLQGKVLLRGQIRDDHPKVVRLDVGALMNGIYIVSIVPANQARFTEQLVIMKEY